MTLKELIARHASDLSDDYPAIAARLNAATTIDNPDAGEKTTTTTPRAISLTDVFGVIAALDNGAAEMAKLSKLPSWAYDGAVAAMVERNDESMTNWLATIAAICGFEPETLAAMTGAKTTLLAATIETTSTQPATISAPSLAQAAGLGTVSAAQIQQAMNA